MPNLPCTLPSCQHHGLGQHPGGIILPGSVPRSREMKPCHHPLSDSKFCINWLIKCRADFLSCPPPQHSKAGLEGTDGFGDAGSPQQPGRVWGESPRLTRALGGLGAVQGCVLPGQDHLAAQMAGVHDPGIFVPGDCLC